MNRFMKLLYLNALIIGSASLGMDTDMSNKLCDAAYAGNLEQVKALLEAGIPADAKPEGSNTPLMLTAIKGHKSVCQFLLDHNANVNQKDIGGWTPLTMAANYGYKEICQLLIERNIQIDTKDTCGLTSLTWAGENGHIDICQLLINEMIKTIKKMKLNQKTAIALMSIKRYHKAKCMDQIDHNIIQLIAHQIYKPVEVAQEIQNLFDQIDAISDQTIKEKLLDYAHAQLNPKKQKNNHCTIA
jgi:ankyrin repeat protein